MSFGSYLAESISRAGFTQKEFAKKVRQKPQVISEVIKGKRGPPVKHLELWSSVLGSVVDVREFRERALLAHCPKEIQELVGRLRGN